ncbi:YhjD/YihY/BrkB family envelope integrity protein [Mycoplasmopsis ciconiae]|uniref:YhjD/YihY/BrkB family envelope integrity protein n=1 Tax=Mycoplasmopsis ciconiae TaxID=561067 RepID=A0ABU7MMN2_9BACT|nr:YhjD/YihY/BrkB family envelope integrity protein [Mycoplasmopsis ciconiae]
MKLLKISSTENSNYKKYLKKHPSFNSNVKKVYKKSSFINNINWPPLIKINIYEIVTKFIIKIIFFILTPSNILNNNNKTKEVINRAYSQFTSKTFSFIPSSSSMYFIVSFAPIVIVSFLMLIWSGNYSIYLLESIISWVVPGISDMFQYLAEDGLNLVLGNTTGITATFLLLISCLWFASSGYGRLVASENMIYKHKYVGTWIGNRLKGLLIVFGISLYLALFTIVHFHVAKALNFLVLNSSGFYILDNSTFNFAQYFFNSISALVFLLIGFYLLLKFTPSFKLKFEGLKNGVAVATVPSWILVCVFGSFAKLSNFGKYGPLGIFMFLSILVSWLTYFCYLGILINASYFKTYISERTMQKKAIFKF